MSQLLLKMEQAVETCRWQHINTGPCSGAQTLTLCYSKCGLWTSNMAITWELWKRYHLLARARSPGLESAFITKSSKESNVPKMLQSAVVDMYVYRPWRSGAHTHTYDFFFFSHTILICDSSLDLRNHHFFLQYRLLHITLWSNLFSVCLFTFVMWSFLPEKFGRLKT